MPAGCGFATETAGGDLFGRRGRASEQSRELASRYGDLGAASWI